MTTFRHQYGCHGDSTGSASVWQLYKTTKKRLFQYRWSFFSNFAVHFRIMLKRLFILFVLFVVFSAQAQNDTVLFSTTRGMYDDIFSSGSNLPIVVIETDGGIEIPDEPKVLGSMKIIWHQDGSRNYLTDIDNPQYLNYNGRIGIETRGSTSQVLPKKPYGLTTLQTDNITNNNVSILGMPKENDWILNSLAYDQTGMRDVLAYELSESLGQYASRRVYCEVVVNGDYKGLYVFMEKIKADKGRVNIEKMDSLCSSYPEVTGGYIVKADKADTDEPVAWSMIGNDFWEWSYYTYYFHHYPKPENITEAQHEYIKSVFFDFDAEAENHNESIIDGYPSIIDIPSFVDFMMIAEYTSNVDVYNLSTFFHKDRNGKLRAGPVWDYNLSFGYDEFDDRSRYDVWQFHNGSNDGSRFWTDLFFYCPTFRCYFAKRWNDLSSPGQPLNYSSVEERIDYYDSLISEAIIRDNQRWWHFIHHAEFVDDMKEWIQLRIGWLNENVGSCQDCAEVEVPPLVISKINYHPQDYGNIDGDRLEFIEITNNGDDAVDLTGIYFRELGISYSFPVGSSMEGHEAIMLCSDSLSFISYYNSIPFGQFTRYLSDKSQNLVLADAWGNVIDEVHYSNTYPWPVEADGRGLYLELIDLNLDNSLPESWMAVLDVEEYSCHPIIRLYPNPSSDEIHLILNVDASFRADEISIYDLLGRKVYAQPCVVTDNQTEITLYPQLETGIYLLRMGSYTQKIVRY